MPEAVIVAAVRTPIGAHGGALASVRPDDLAALVVALGHPLGCSGARILTTLLHEMRRRAPGERRPYFGLATLCVGVGQGEATIVEWVG